MYDPVLGRFISVDPVMDLTDPQQWNAYSYANGNPVTWFDPTGLKPIGGNGGAEENKWANSVSKRMNRDARERSRSTYVAPPTCWGYCGSDLEAAGAGAGLAAGVAMPTAPGAAAVSVANEVKQQALNLRIGKTRKIQSVGAKSQALLRDSVGWREFAAGGRTSGAKALGPIGTVAGGVISAKTYWDQNDQIVGMETKDKVTLTTAQTGVDIGAGLAGAAAGAKAGALIGSFFAPGVGTLIGAAVGGIVGGIGGAAVAGYAGNALGRHGRENAASGRRWWEL